VNEQVAQIEPRLLQGQQKPSPLFRGECGIVVRTGKVGEDAGEPDVRGGE
jgi:hypothetical protein